jgi:hypothetical protein
MPPIRSGLPLSTAAVFIFGLLVGAAPLARAGDSRDAIAEKATESIRENRRADAATYLYELVRQQNVESYHCQFGTIQESLRLVREFGLLDEIIAANRPPADAPFEQRKDFAITLVHLTSPEIQRENLEKLHAEQPGDPRLLTLLAIATPIDQLQRLIPPITRLTPPELTGFLKMLTDEMRPYYRSEAEFHRDMDMVQWLAEVLVALPPEDCLTVNFDCIRHLAKDRTTFHFSFGADGSIRIPPLLEEAPCYAPPADPKDKEFIGKIAGARDKSLQKLAAASLQHPALSALGFHLLYVGRATFPVTDSQLHEAAIAAIQCHLKAYHPQSASRQPTEHNRLSNLSATSFPMMIGTELGLIPEDFATADAQAHRLAAVPPALLDALDPALAPQVRQWIAFLEQPDPAQVADLLARLQSEPTSSISFNLAALLLELTAIDPGKGFELLLDRYDFAPLLQARPWSSGVFSPPLRFEKIIGRHYARHSDPAVAAAGLHRIAVKLLGPENTWPEYQNVLIHHAGDNRAFLPNSPKSAPLSAFVHITGQSCEQGPSRPKYNLLRFVNSHGLPAGIASAESAEKIINRYPFPAFFQEVTLQSNLFSPGPGMFGPDGKFIPPQLIHSGNPGDFAMYGAELLKVTGPQQFWSTLTGALWTARDAAFVRPGLERELPAIRTSTASTPNSAKTATRSTPPRSFACGNPPSTGLTTRP